MNALTRTVARALTEAPSLREISRRAGVSPAQLSRIVSGQRNATPEVARAVADALSALGADCEKGAARVRRSLTATGGKP
jgi:transcriptional regulator with XRE-family HTH domain